MTSSLDNTSGSTGDRARSRAYLRDFLPAVGAYVVLLSAVLAWGHLDGSSPSRYAWAVLPVVPALWGAWAVRRHVRRIDDYQRLLLLQSLATAFAVAMVVALTLGFLGVAGLPMRDAGWVVYVAGMLTWLVTGARSR